MRCDEFLGRFSEYYDGYLDAGERAPFEAHRASCPRCERYERVVESSSRLLRSMGDPPIPEGLREKVESRIRRGEGLDVLPFGRSGSAVGAGAVVALTALMALAAWLPLVLDRSADAELPVISAAPPMSFPARPATDLFPTLSSFRTTALESDLWTQPNWLLYEYSALSRRGQPSVRRASRSLGLQ